MDIDRGIKNIIYSIMDMKGPGEGQVMSTFLEKYPELLDLGEDEAKVYGFLNAQGESSAKIISGSCNIPYSKIHRVLYRLQKQELVISRGEAPKLFALRFKDPELSKRYARERRNREKEKP
jgi:sugar-specific transcriptional regulator TrmB